MMPNDENTAGNKPVTIEPNKKHLILCEGKDDEEFLSYYLKSGVFSQYDMNAVQVAQIHGVDNLRIMLRILVNTDRFSQLHSLLIIRDADTNIQGAKDSVKGALSHISLPVPWAEYRWKEEGSIKTGFLLMPSCSDQSQPGALDDLCWEILSEKHGASICGEVEQFITSLEADGKRSYSHKNKALVHTYFSATDDLISSSVGRAAKAGAFDWTNPKLDPLRDFLIQMVS